jgi:hypothetical protein
VTLRDILNPWAAIREAREKARFEFRRANELERVTLGQRSRIDQLYRDLSFIRSERDTARETALEAIPFLEELAAIKHRRSEAISRGNRTRARRRRGGLLPAPINDIADAPAPHVRTELTG